MSSSEAGGNERAAEPGTPEGLSSFVFSPGPGPAFSDDALALRFVNENAAELRYVAVSNKWFEWTGVMWREDITLLVYSQARLFCRNEARKVNESGAKGVASHKTVNAVVSMARCDRRVATRLEQWDSDPLLLNTPDGTVELGTGQIRAHDPADYITRCTAVGPGGERRRWQEFLDRITDGNETLQGFLKRLAGYCLTGLTEANALFFLHGLGANGKSVFVNTLTGIAADYHRVAPMEMLIAGQSDRHPTELAGLVGCRIATAVETEQGRRWNEAKIKALTGGDRVSARFMRADFFDYVPQFKLIVSGNHKPSLNTVDEAIRRRLYLVPFTVTIPPEERDLRARRETESRVAWDPAVGNRGLRRVAPARAMPAALCHRGDARISRQSEHHQELARRVHDGGEGRRGAVVAHVRVVESVVRGERREARI